MINDNILQRFIHDLGTLTCGEEEVIQYFRGYGVEPQEYIDVLSTIPRMHVVNGKVWCDQR